MNQIEARLLRLEGLVQRLAAQVSSLADQVGQLAQNQYAEGAGTGGGGSGGQPLVCVMSAALSAAGTPSTGSPTTTGSQTVYTIGTSGFDEGSTSATIINALPNAISSGSTVLLEQNRDGSYTIIAVACSGS